MKNIVCVYLLMIGHSVAANDLVQALASAKANDALFSSSLHAKAAGEEKKEQARSLYLPRLSMSANYGYTDNQTKYGSEVLSDVSREGENYGYTLSMAYPLYDGENTANYYQLMTQAEQSGVQFEVAEQQLILRVVRAYFDLVIAHESMKSTLARKKSVEEQLAKTNKMFEIGAIPINASYEAKAAFDKVIADEIAVRNELKLSKDAFIKLTGLLPTELAVLSSSIEPASLNTEGLRYWKELATENNLDILVRKHELKVAKHEADKHEFSSSPRFELHADYEQTWDGSDLSHNGARDEYDEFYVGVRFSMPLYTGGYRSSKKREAASLAMKKRDLLDMTYRNVDQAIYRAFLNINDAVAKYHAMQQLVKSSEVLFESNKVGRAAGLRTTADVLRADRAYHEAQLELVISQYDYLYSRLELEYVAGHLQEEDVYSINTLFEIKVL